MNRLPRRTISKLLLEVEAIVHRKGWDQQSFLTALDWTRPEKLALAEIPLPIQNPPGDFVNYVGQTFMNDPQLAKLVLQTCRRFYGMAFVCEGWQAKPDMTEEEHTEALRAGRGYADQVGAKEVRMITAIDLHSRIYFIQRVRGEKPIEHGPEGVTLGGQVIEGLRKMTLACARQLPDNLEYVTLLNSLKIEQREVIVKESQQ